MYKASYRNVSQLLRWGVEDEEISDMILHDLQPVGHVFAYYTPSNANWSWQIGIYKVNGQLYELLTRFGSVEGGRKLYTIEYTYQRDK